MVSGFSHLPPAVEAAIEDYEHRCDTGELAFDGEFANEPAGSDKWESDLLAAHLPAMDFQAAG